MLVLGSLRLESRLRSVNLPPPDPSDFGRIGAYQTRSLVWTEAPVDPMVGVLSYPMRTVG